VIYSAFSCRKKLHGVCHYLIPTEMAERKSPEVPIFLDFSNGLINATKLYQNFPQGS